jgi:hypothetical protein
MTSQLILLNGFGVALASDSAMTLGNKRTYETAEKIIPLPSPHRLAVLHAGSVTIHGMPYSVLVNEWATTLGSTPLRTVALYRQNFLSWLNDNHDWVTPGRATDDFMYQLRDIYKVIWNKIKESVDDSDSESVKQDKCLAVFTYYTDLYESLPSLSHSEGDWINQAYSRIEEEVTKSRNYWFDDIPMSDAINQHIDVFTRLYLERGHFLSRAELSFAGFGDKQLLPSYAKVEIGGIMNESLLYELAGERSAQAGESGYFDICPIGQSDSIDLVLKGLDYRLVAIARDAAMRSLTATEGSASTEADNEKAAQPATVPSDPEVARKMYEAIDHAFGEWSENNYVKGLRSAIASLPVASLATVARSLIEVQSLSQTITGEMGTVGGPIDVATISRENGFQWVRHKSTAV